MDYTVREIKPEEYALLASFLYEAIYLPPGAQAPPKSVLLSPELQVYLDKFGEKQDDQGLVAVVNDTVVGVVWVRIMNDYGHMDDETPSFAIALYPQYRGLGIGTTLLRTMLVTLKKQGYKRASLAVQKENHAARLYQRVGFQIVRETNEEYIMTIDLQE